MSRFGRSRPTRFRCPVSRKCRGNQECQIGSLVGKFEIEWNYWKSRILLGGVGF